MIMVQLMYTHKQASVEVSWEETDSSTYNTRSNYQNVGQYNKTPEQISLEPGACYI